MVWRCVFMQCTHHYLSLLKKYKQHHSRNGMAYKLVAYKRRSQMTAQTRHLKNHPQQNEKNDYTDQAMVGV
jgi:hypothetical protein